LLQASHAADANIISVNEEARKIAKRNFIMQVCCPKIERILIGFKARREENNPASLLKKIIISSG
jgi:intergrase/recombinase